MITVMHSSSILGDSLISVGNSGYIVCGGVSEDAFLYQLEVVAGDLGGVWWPIKEVSLWREEFSKLHFDIKEGRVNIFQDLDDYDCECCGVNFSSGYVVEVNGEEYLELAASAGCFYSPNFHYIDVILYLLDIYNIPYKLEEGHSPYLAIKNS